MGKKNKEEKYVITPKGCLWIAMYEVVGSQMMTEKEFDDVWKRFESYMNNAGYIKN